MKFERKGEVGMNDVGLEGHLEQNKRARALKIRLTEANTEQMTCCAGVLL